MRPMTESRRVFTSSRWLVLVGLVGGLLAGLLAWGVVGTSYSSEAIVRVEPISGTPFNQVEAVRQLNMQSEVQVAGSQSVSSVVVERADDAGLSIDQLEAGSLAVSNPPESTILVFSYTSPDSSDSAALANEYASGYLQYRQTQAEAAIDRIDSTLEKESKALARESRRLYKELREVPVRERAAIKASAEIVNAQLADVNQSQLEVRAIDVNPGAVIDEASVPERPSTPSFGFWLVFGLCGGLVFGVVLVWARESLLARTTGYGPGEQDAELARARPVSSAQGADGRVDEGH